MTSALRQEWQKIFNQLPYFVAIFWIGISSATTGTNFVLIDHHLSECKKPKGVPFYETPCRKWHTPCQIRWKSLTLDDLKRHFVRFSTENWLYLGNGDR